jgi:hypothetical protein
MPQRITDDIGMSAFHTGGVFHNAIGHGTKRCAGVLGMMVSPLFGIVLPSSAAMVVVLQGLSYGGIHSSECKFHFIGTCDTNQGFL